MRYRDRTLGVVFALLASVGLLASSGADAAAIGDGTSGHPRLVLAGAELGPFAYTHFCVRYPDECIRHTPATAGERAVTSSPERALELQAVNAAVNRAIRPVARTGAATYDSWRIDPNEGDCNDYAVSKRHALLARGWPSTALLLAEVITPWGEHHLVLLARTSAGDMVLDNLSGAVRDWSATRYTWIRAQMPDEPSLWAALRKPTEQLAARDGAGTWQRRSTERIRPEPPVKVLTYDRRALIPPLRSGGGWHVNA